LGKGYSAWRCLYVYKMKKEKEVFNIKIKKFYLGSQILKFELPARFVDTINEIYDNKINEMKPHNEYLAGKIEDEHEIDPLLPKEMKDNFLSMFKTYLIEVQRPHWECKLTSAWVNEMKEHEYNPMHHHTSKNSDLGLSSVLFLKLPDTYGREYSKEQLPANGRLEFVGGNQDLLGINNLKVLPEEGDFYVFPFTMLHGVYPFNGTKECRRSLSYNCDLIKPDNITKGLDRVVASMKG